MVTSSPVRFSDSSLRVHSLTFNNAVPHKKKKGVTICVTIFFFSIPDGSQEVRLRHKTGFGYTKVLLNAS